MARCSHMAGWKARTINKVGIAFSGDRSQHALYIL